MPGHPTPARLHAYAARTIPAREILRVDRHVSSCAECAAVLERVAGVAPASALLRRVRRAGPHLAYEQFEALVDGGAPLEPAAEMHLAGCATCRREFAEMRGYAASLSARVDRHEPAPSLATRLGTWFGNPRSFGAAAAVVALGVAVSAVWQGGLLDMSHDATIRSAPVGGATQGVPQGAYDRGVLDELATISASAQVAYQLNDFASVAKALEPLAAAGDARAQNALGLLYAEGRGVDASTAEAERWWGLAADRSASARHNLSVLRQNASRKSTR